MQPVYCVRVTALFHAPFSLFLLILSLLLHCYFLVLAVVVFFCLGQVSEQCYQYVQCIWLVAPKDDFVYSHCFLRCRWDEQCRWNSYWWQLPLSCIVTRNTWCTAVRREQLCVYLLQYWPYSMLKTWIREYMYIYVYMYTMHASFPTSCTNKSFYLA